jgi:chromosomal replication initiation ATPase DnaA
MKYHSIHITTIKKAIDIDDCLLIVSHFTGISHTAMLGRTRKREFVEARFLFCALAKELTTSSLRKIGNKVNISHSNVIHAIKSVNEIRELKYRYSAMLAKDINLKTLTI